MEDGADRMLARRSIGCAFDVLNDKLEPGCGVHDDSLR